MYLSVGGTGGYLHRLAWLCRQEALRQRLRQRLQLLAMSREVSSLRASNAELSGKLRRQRADSWQAAANGGGGAGGKKTAVDAADTAVATAARAAEAAAVASVVLVPLTIASEIINLVGTAVSSSVAVSSAATLALVFAHKQRHLRA